MSKKLTVLYNASCPICSREIEGYRRAVERAGAAVGFEGLQEADLASWGLTADIAARRLHVRLADGEIRAGLPAFRALWSEVPGLAWLARFTGLPGVAPAAGWIYECLLAPTLYAMHRRRIRRGSCNESACL